MIDTDLADGAGRYRNKRHRGRQQRKKSQRKRTQRGYQEPYKERILFEIPDERSVLGGRQPRSKERKVMPNDGPPDAFLLFSAVYLGVTPTDGYHKPQFEEVASRFGMNSTELKELLIKHELDDETLHRTGFDLEAARLDVRVAPQGISRLEIARDHFHDFLAAKEDLKNQAQ